MKKSLTQSSTTTTSQSNEGGENEETTANDNNQDDDDDNDSGNGQNSDEEMDRTMDRSIDQMVEHRADNFEFQNEKSECSPSQQPNSPWSQFDAPVTPFSSNPPQIQVRKTSLTHLGSFSYCDKCRRLLNAFWI